MSKQNQEKKLVTDGLPLAEREQKSTRLRYTLEVAELAGFKYDAEKTQYGGFFSIYQLERIKNKLLDLKRLQAEVSSVTKRQ